ncbi:unnamed protein product [Heterobilharzia americana]|nr:unnamed protein product [Heterobilharzia americana]CAH8487329.1 unnamed protein product [Heterobilharzia americana]
MKDGEGNLVTKRGKKQRKRWSDHFKKTLESTATTTCNSSRNTTSSLAIELPVNTSSPTKPELLNAIKLLKSVKAPRPDGIPPEALKTDLETTADTLRPLLQKVSKVGKVPAS